jgi:hypothetical protein
LLAGVVDDRTDNFVPGENVILQCTLVPPHEDMWVTCCLEDASGRQLHETGQAVTRDMIRVNFNYQFPPQIQPGRFRFVIRAHGDEVLTKSVEVAGKRGSVLTN